MRGVSFTRDVLPVGSVRLLLKSGVFVPVLRACGGCGGTVNEEPETWMEAGAGARGERFRGSLPRSSSYSSSWLGCKA
jgi:hypothetical protein